MEKNKIKLDKLLMRNFQRRKKKETRANVCELEAKREGDIALHNNYNL